MATASVKMGTNGRLVIPAALRKELGLAEGEPVVMETEDGKLILHSMADVVVNVQMRLQKYLKRKPSLSQELIADRRREAKRE